MITTREFTKEDWMGFAGATGSPRIAEIECGAYGDDSETLVAITDDTGLSVHVYDNTGDYPGWYHIPGTQALAEHILSKLRPEDLKSTMEAIATWEAC